MGLFRDLHAAQTWITLGILAPIGMVLVSGLMLLDFRRDAWDKAEQTSKNLLQVIERDIARNAGDPRPLATRRHQEPARAGRD